MVRAGLRMDFEDSVQAAKKVFLRLRQSKTGFFDTLQNRRMGEPIRRFCYGIYLLGQLIQQGNGQDNDAQHNEDAQHTFSHNGQGVSKRIQHHDSAPP